MNIKHIFTRSRALAPVTRATHHLMSACLRRNPLQKSSKRVMTLEYLNVGCGKKPFDHTINLDYEWRPWLDLTFDITKRLPFADGRLRGIYCEHVLEHLPFDVIPFVLSEWKRVLRPGGLIRILVPDAELYVLTYCESRLNNQVRFPRHESGKTPMMQVNRCFRDSGHLFAYDFETFDKILQNVGFHDIRKCGYREGKDSALLLDSEERREESLRVEASLEN